MGDVVVGGRPRLQDDLVVVAGGLAVAGELHGPPPVLLPVLPQLRPAGTQHVQEQVDDEDRAGQHDGAHRQLCPHARPAQRPDPAGASRASAPRTWSSVVRSVFAQEVRPVRERTVARQPAAYQSKE